MHSAAKSAGDRHRGLQNATKKAQRFEHRNDAKLRVEAKQAILSELSSQLQIKAAKIRLGRKDEHQSDSNHPSTSVADEKNTTHTTNRTVHGGSSYLNHEGHAQNRGAQTSQIPRPASRSVQTKPKQAKPAGRTHSIQQYRPGYTWNRGGRIKELRIRYQARKYLHLWIDRAFGRVLPSVALFHHQRALKKRMFDEWYDLWWRARKEWRLTIRAECHNRYRLWNKVWKAWRQFTREERVEHDKDYRAVQFAERNVARRAVEIWRRYVEMRRGKHNLNDKARTMWKETAQRQAWLQWLDQYRTAQARQDQETFALRLWADQLTAKAWGVWLTAFHSRRRDQAEERFATIHYKRKIIMKCMQAWQIYTKNRHVKKQHYAFAKEYHTRTTLELCFQHWHTRWRSAHATRQHHYAILELAERSRRRRVFVHWRFYIALKHEDLRKEHLAQDHYECHLLVVAVQSLKTYVMERREKRMKTLQTRDFHHRMQLRQAWNMWISKCEDNEELKIFHLTRKARKHYRQNVLTKVVSCWKVYLQWRIHRKDQYAKADGHFVCNALPKYFYSIKLFAELMREKRENNEKALEFRSMRIVFILSDVMIRLQSKGTGNTEVLLKPYPVIWNRGRRENILCRFFYGWHHIYQESQDVRLLERMAILHYDEKVSKRFLKKWSQATRHSQLEKEKEDTAADHFLLRLCQRCLKAWKDYAEWNKARHAQEEAAAQHLYSYQLRNTWTAWRQYIAVKAQKRKKLKLAEMHYQHQLLKPVIGRWRQHVANQKQTYQVVEEKWQRKSHQSLRWGFLQWRENVRVCLEEKEQEKKAQHQHKLILLKKVLLNWREYSVSRAHKKYTTAQAVREAQEQLKKGVLRRSFILWKQSRDEALLFRLKYQQAIEHHANNVRRAAISQWKGFHRQSLRKALLKRQSVWLHNTRLTARFFLRWRSAHSAALEDKTRTTMALWQWSFVLQRKAFMGWVSYTQEKRRKAARISAALEERRRRKLREGVSRWLLYAADMTKFRQKLAASRQAENAHNLYHTVHKCAIHWKHITLKRKQERGGSVRVRTVGGSGNGRIEGSSGAPAVSRKLVQKSAPLPEPIASASPLARGKVRCETGVAHSDRQRRPRPRQPAFLIDSLKREGLYRPATELEPQPGLPPDGEISNQDQSGLHDESAERIFNSDDSSTAKTNSTSSHLYGGSKEKSKKSVHFKAMPNPDVGHLNASKAVHLLQGPIRHQHDRSHDDNIDETGPAQLFVGSNAQEPVQLTGVYEGRSCPEEKVTLLPPSAFLVSRSGQPLVAVEEPEIDICSLYTPGNPKADEGQENLSTINTSWTNTTPDLQIEESLNQTNVSVDDHENHPISNQEVEVTLEPCVPVYTLHKPSSENRKSDGSHIDKKSEGGHIGCSSEGDREEACTVVEKEILEIRRTLQEFQSRKERLKSLKEQYKILVDWKQSQIEEEFGNDDEITDVDDEINVLEVELEELSKLVEEQKPECRKMVEKVNSLILKLGDR